MIGQILFRHSGPAVLDDDGHWSCPDKAIEGYLNLNFAMDGWYGSPSAGRQGAAAIGDAARELGGVARYARVAEPESDPDVVY